MLFEQWRAPVYRLLIPFASGITIYNACLPSRSLTLAILIGSLILAYSLNRRKSTTSWAQQPLIGVSLCIALTSAGILFSFGRDLRQQPDWVGQIPSDQANWLFEVRDEAKQTQSGWRITADLLACQRSIKINSVQGGVQLYTNNDSIAMAAKPGDRFWIATQLHAIRNTPKRSFNYARYCLQQKITHQGYLSANAPLYLATDSKNWLTHRLHRIQSELRNRIYAGLPDSSSAGLAAALLIGWKGGLDAELKQHYTRTGTIHIIAISGLHISLVFEILWLLLHPLLLIRGGAILRQLLALGCIWTFCFIAGAEASVLRAGIMFTAIALGRWMERPTSGMQALGLSMLCLLVADPDWLFDPGFQLSHAAVAGILILHPKLSALLQPKNLLLKNSWESACMTLAATAATLPFTGYYFHQFPGLFLPANLIAVPLSSLALLGLFLLIPCASIPQLLPLLGGLVSKLLDLMNEWVTQLDRIPGAVFRW